MTQARLPLRRDPLDRALAAAEARLNRDRRRRRLEELTEDIARAEAGARLTLDEQLARLRTRTPSR